MKLFRDSLLLALAGALGSIYSLVDKSFISQLGSHWLAIESLVSYLPLVLATFGKATGQTLVAKASVSDQVRIGSLQLLIAFCVVISLFVVSVILSSQTLLMNDPSAVVFFVLNVLAGLFGALNVVFKYQMLIQSRIAAMIGFEITGNSINWVFNSLSFWVFDGSDFRFIGVAVATLIVQIALFYLYSHQLKQRGLFQVTAVRERITDCWQAVSSQLQGEWIYMLTSIGLPLAMSFLLTEYEGDRVVGALNFGMSWARLPSVILFSVILVATRNAVAARDQRGALSAHSVFRDLNRIAGLIFFVSLLLTPWVARQYSISSPGFVWMSEEGWLLMSAWVTPFCVALSAGGYVLLRTQGRSADVGRVTLISQGVAGVGVGLLSVGIGFSVAESLALGFGGGQVLQALGIQIVARGVRAGLSQASASH